MNAHAEPAVGAVEQAVDRALTGIRLSIDPRLLALLTTLCAAASGLALAAESRLIGVPLGVVSLLLAALTGVALRRDGVPAGSRALGVLFLVIAEAALLVGAAILARARDDGSLPLAIAVFALAGVVSLTYARMRILASASIHLSDGPGGIAAREARIAILLIAVALGLPYAGMIVAAAVAHFSVVAHLVTLRSRLQD